MSSITFADNKTGGRIQAACDAIAAGHFNRAAGILAEVADELNVEATEAGLLSEVEESAPVVAPVIPPLSVTMQGGAPADLQMCGRGVHSFGPLDPISGWRECTTCGQVNVSPPEDSGPIDMSARQ